MDLFIELKPIKLNQMKYDLKKEKIAVHCQTLEEAEKVVNKMLKSGIELQDDASKNETIGFFKLGSAFFFSAYEYKIDSWEDKEEAMKQGFKIIPASDYLSQFEDVPKYGDKVWIKGSEKGKWSKKPQLTIGMIAGKCAILQDDVELYEFEQGDYCAVALYEHYRTTDPAKDKKVLELTMSEIAEKLGVDEVKIKE